MTIKDRGNIKWNSLMLVEHKKMLEKLKDEEKDKNKPQLDEQELQRLNRILHQAIEEKLTVKIIYYREKRYYNIKGVIEKYLLSPKMIVMNNSKTEKVYLSTEDVINIKLV